MSDPNVIYSKLYNEDKTQTFRLKLELEEDYFRLFVMEGNKAWFSLVTTQHLKKLAKQHDINFVAYMETIRNYISHDPTSITVEIILESKEFIIRHKGKEKFKAKYFVTKLEELNYQHYAEGIIDSLMLKCKEMNSKIFMLDEQKLEVEKEKTAIEHKCEELAEMKYKSDRQLYSSVALILNEKKKRIQFLTELLEEYQNGNMKKKASSNTQQSESNKVRTTKNTDTLVSKPSTSKREAISDSDQSANDECTTDEETIERQSVADNLDFLGDDSPPHLLAPKRFKSYKFTLPEVQKSEKDVCVITNTDIEIKANSTPEKQPQSEQFDTQDLLDMM